MKKRRTKEEERRNMRRTRSSNELLNTGLAGDLAENLDGRGDTREGGGLGLKGLGSDLEGETGAVLVGINVLWR